MTSDGLNHKFLYLPKRALVFSLGLHGAVVVFFIATKILDYFGIPLFRSEPPINTKQVYQSFIQVDMVALPDQMLNEKFDASLPVVDKPAALPDPLPVTETKEDVLQAPEPTKQDPAMTEKAVVDKKPKPDPELEKKAQAEKRKKEQDIALKRIQEEANREAALKALAAKGGRAGRPKLKGNKVSSGTSTSGIIGTPQDRYLALLKEAIQRHFNIYDWQRKKKPVAHVFIRLFPTGRVREKKLVKPSADPVYNSSVMQAIDAAQPLPLPEDPALLDGITIIFQLEE